MGRAQTVTAASETPSVERIKAEAYAYGFDLAGIVRLGPVGTAVAFDEWLQRGYAGTMSYLERGAAARRDSRSPVPSARSAIVVAMNYDGTQPPGPIARYARGRDYHDVLREKLERLHRWLDEAYGRPVPGKAYVDTGPILERDLAQRAGLGWFGKNSCLINPRLGSFFFLGLLLLDLDLEADQPFQFDRCGTCTRCIDACPTQAIVEPRVVDARRCISYLTIELREEIPRELRGSLGTLVFGCDICQEVCPWNVQFSRALASPELAPLSGNAAADPRDLLGLSEEAFRERFKGSAVKRAKRRGLVRNAAVALGNLADPGDVPALARALHDPEPLVRGHAAWALGRIGTPAARQALAQREAVEPDAAVLDEVRSAMMGELTDSR
jgi:epoxyqueuosine reductase